MAVVVKHECGGNALPLKAAGYANTGEPADYECLRCRKVFKAHKPPTLIDVTELVGNAGAVEPEAVECGYEARGIGDSWTQEYKRIAMLTKAAALFVLPDGREVWVPLSVLIAVERDRFYCATWFARKEIDV